MEQSCGLLSVEMVLGKHCDFSTYLAKRAIAHSGACAEEQFPDYGTVLWYPGCRNGSRKPGKHCDFSTYLTKRARAQFGACAEVHLPDYGTVLWATGSRKFPGKHCDFSTYLAKRTSAQSGACAEVQFPDYGTVLWSPDCRNDSRKALRFQNLSCQESENSICRLRRGAIS
jgi:hypothetical protein